MVHYVLPNVDVSKLHPFLQRKPYPGFRLQQPRQFQQQQPQQSQPQWSQQWQSQWLQQSWLHQPQQSQFHQPQQSQWLQQSQFHQPQQSQWVQQSQFYQFQQQSQAQWLQQFQFQQSPWLQHLEFYQPQQSQWLQQSQQLQWLQQSQHPQWLQQSQHPQWLQQSQHSQRFQQSQFHQPQQSQRLQQSPSIARPVIARPARLQSSDGTRILEAHDLVQMVGLFSLPHTGQLNIARAEMALPRFRGNKRHNESMPEMVTPPKRQCVRSEKDSIIWQKNDNQQKNITQSPRPRDQQYDQQHLVQMGGLFSLPHTGHLDISWAEMALLRFPGNKRHNDSMPEMITPPQKQCVRSEKDSVNCEKNNQKNDITQSPKPKNQQYDQQYLVLMRGFFSLPHTGQLDISWTETAFPRFPGSKRHNDPMPEMVTPLKKQCVRSKNENNNCERSKNQQNDITQSPRPRDQQYDQQYDITQAPKSETQQYDITKDQQCDVTDSPICEDREPDFSHLPTLVWTIIMSNLEERDRLALAATCGTLYSLCKSESILWRSANMHLGNWERMWNDRQVELNPTEISVLQAHSHQIQEMDIVIEDLHGLRFSERSFHILKEAVTNWPLKKKLRIYCKVDDVCVCPVEPMVDNVGHLIMNSLTSEKTKGLERLVVRKCFWTYGDEGSVILEALKVSPFTDSLQYLGLGAVRTTQQLDLSHTIPQVVECVGRFQNLRELCLWVQYLSDLLLEMLSKSMTSQFKALVFSGNFESFQEDITKWPQLLSSCPNLRVEFDMECRVNCEDTLAAFPHIVPVTYVKIRNFNGTSEHDTDSRTGLLKLLPVYSKTLAILDWLDESKSNFESVLIDTVERCPKLIDLVFNGRINSSSISTLASMKDWLSLKFLERSITLPESNTETRDVQMSKLKTAIHSLLGNRCEFVQVHALATDLDLSGQGRPIHFKVKCQPIQL